MGAPLILFNMQMQMMAARRRRNRMFLFAAPRRDEEDEDDDQEEQKPPGCWSLFAPVLWVMAVFLVVMAILVTIVCMFR